MERPLLVTEALGVKSLDPTLSLCEFYVLPSRAVFPRSPRRKKAARRAAFRIPRRLLHAPLRNCAAGAAGLTAIIFMLVHLPMSWVDGQK